VANKKISIVICTYNRDFILPECIDSLIAQSADKKNYEIIVVNNNSNDNTQAIIDKYSSTYPNFRNVFEEKQGLSHARNRGAAEAGSEWVFYIDDDAKARPDLVSRALYIIDNYNFDCFGGTYIAWWKYGQPKWLKSINFGTKPLELSSVGVLTKENALCHGYLSGGVFCVKKNILEKMGGFSPSLGMSGDSSGYGEEILLQDQLRENGYIVGYDPTLIIEHLVADYKLKLLWHLKARYYHGRDSVTIWADTKSKSWFYIFLKLLKDCVFNFFKLFKKEYFIQNYIIESLGPTLSNIGRKKAVRKMREKK